MRHAIRGLPAAHLAHESVHDPLPPLREEGIPVRAVVDVDPAAERITVDLRDNIDCMANGLNLSKATAINNAVTGVFNCLAPDVPRNAGAFRRIEVLLRENCAIGIPRFPHSCSVATTNLADRLVNTVQAAFSKLGDGYGLAEGGVGMGAATCVISGTDSRRGGAAYVNQLILGNDGGPASPTADGWLTYEIPVVAGLMYRDSVEVIELKYPIHVRSLRIATARGGAGRRRGAPGFECVYGPRREPMVAVFAQDGQQNAPRGVRGGHDGNAGESWKIDRNGAETRLGNVGQVVAEPGEWLRGLDTGGGGYGDPRAREPERVLADVLEGWETIERARDVYGVALTGDVADESLAVDPETTERLRKGTR
jgi:N-methylhydantoinase B